MERTGASDHRAFAVQLGALTFAYTLFAYVGLNWATVAGAGSPVWPASGIALAALLVWGVRLWPAILVGRILAALLSGSDQPLWADAMIGAANAGGSVLAVLLIRRLGPFDLRLASLPDMVRYLVAGASVGALASAVVGTSTLAVSSGLGMAQVEATFFTWLVGNFVGAITLGPLLLAWTREGALPVGLRRWLHLLLVLLATLSLSWLAFTTPANESLRTFHLLPILVWAAVAFHVRGASAALVIMSAVAVWGTSEQLGPFVQLASSPSQAVPLMQQYIAVAAVTVLLLGAVSDERRGKEAVEWEARRARDAEARLRRAQEAGGIGTYEWDLATGQGEASEKVADIVGLPTDQPVRLKTLLSLVHEDDREQVKDTVAMILAGSPSLGTEYRIRRQSDGEVRWIFDKGSVQSDEAGQPARWVGTLQDVTERKVAEIARAAGEAQLRALIEQMPVGVAVAMVPSGEYLIYNSKAAEILGHPLRPADDLSAHGSYGAMHLDGSPYAAEEYPLARVVETGRAVNEEAMIYRRGNGDLIELEVKAAPILDGEGQMVLAVCSFEDVTERKAAQLSLQDSESRVRRVLDQLFAFVGLTTLDGTLLEANRAPLEAAGITAADVLGKKFWETYWWSHSSAVRKRVRSALARAALGEVVRFEVQARMAGGTLLTIDFQVSPLRRADGQITHLIPSAVVIEDRVQAEAERRRLASILEATPDFVITSDVEGRTLYANPAARRLIGLSPDDPVEELSLSRHAPEAAADRLVKRAFPKAAKDGFWEGESELLRADGSSVPVSQVVLAHRNDLGEVDFYSTIARDLSERKVAEEREQLLAREVDHRGKNLLAVVQSIIQLARADTVADMKTALTGRIQSLARTQSLLAAGRWEGADLKKLIADELEPYMRGRESTVRLQGPSIRLKPSASQTLALVIHELTTNAVKYGSLSSEGGRVDVTWAISLGVDQDQLRLRWQERGGPEVHSPSRRGFGSIVTRTSIERQLKGTLVHDWQPGGLVCDITLPMQEIVAGPASTPAQVSRRKVAVPETGGDIAGRRVLVVEDEALIAVQIEEVLGNAGCIVVGPATRIAEAFDFIHETPPDAALLDVNVAGERSFAVAEILASKGIPFAFCTGYEDLALPERFRGCMILRKPVDPAAMIASLAALMSKAEGRTGPLDTPSEVSNNK